jgi:hypothetical protein
MENDRTEKQRQNPLPTWDVTFRVEIRDAGKGTLGEMASDLEHRISEAVSALPLRLVEDVQVKEPGVFDEHRAEQRDWAWSGNGEPMPMIVHRFSLN